MAASMPRRPCKSPTGSRRGAVEGLSPPIPPLPAKVRSPGATTPAIRALSTACSTLKQEFSMVSPQFHLPLCPAFGRISCALTGIFAPSYLPSAILLIIGYQTIIFSIH